MKKFIGLMLLASSFSLFAQEYNCESTFVLPSGDDWTTVGYGMTQNDAAINAVAQCLRYGFDKKTCTPYVVECWKNSPMQPFAHSTPKTWQCISLSIDNYSATVYGQNKEEATTQALEKCELYAEVPDSCFVRCL